MSEPDNTKPDEPKPKRRGSMGQPTRGRRRKDVVSGRFVTKLTPEVIANLEQALASGLPPAEAAPFAGIARETLRRWMMEGRTPGCEPIYVELIETIEQALSRWATGIATGLTKAARDDPRAAMFLLERRLPAVFGRHDRVDVGNAEGEPLKILTASFDARDLAGLPADQLEALRALFAAQAEKDSNVIDLPVRRQLGP
jgi:hypothetical protein